MATTIAIPGLIAVKIGNATTRNLLGYARDGIQINEIVRMRPIYGDEGGGPDGVPVDFSYLGEYHEVRMELYKYDGNILVQVLNRLNSTSKQRNMVWDPGWMVRSAGEYFALELVSENRMSGADPQFRRIYPVAIPVDPISYPLGPREMVVMLQFMCFADSTGTLFTTS